MQLRENFYVIGGAGGNILVQIGPEGVVLVETAGPADEVVKLLPPLTVDDAAIDHVVEVLGLATERVIDKLGEDLLSGTAPADEDAGEEVAKLVPAAKVVKCFNTLGYSNFAVPRPVLAAEYRRLVEHAVVGEITVDVERGPLERVADAWRRQAAGEGGKQVIVLQDRG